MSKEAFVSVPYIQGLSEEFRRIFKNTKVQITFKGCNTLKTLLMPLKDKIPTHLCQDVVHQWTCPTENCSSTYLVESSRCLESRVKEHSTLSTSTIFQHNTTCNHPKADISQFKTLDQDSKQVSGEAREAIHIRRNNHALNHNIDKMNIPKIFNQILNTDINSSAEDSNSQPHHLANSSNRATRATHFFN